MLLADDILQDAHKTYMHKTGLLVNNLQAGVCDAERFVEIS